MAWVYILRGARRHYIGATDNLDRRIAEHKRGSNHTTLRFGDHIEVVAAKELPSMTEARKLEQTLKRKKSAHVAISILQSTDSIVGQVPCSTLFLMFESMFMTIIAK